MEQKVRVRFIDMDQTDALEEYARDKFLKHDNLLKKMTSMDIYLTQDVHNRGVSKDFRVDVNLSVPNSRIHVEEIGEDMYAIIDKASDKLFRRLKRYHDKLQQWEGTVPWRVLEAEEAMRALSEKEEEGDSPVNYSDYVPEIAVRKTVDNLTPREEAEAIELMELGGFNQYLFRNKEGKICMVYKRSRGGYGLVEPADSALDQR